MPGAGITELNGLLESSCGPNINEPGVIEAYECDFGCQDGACVPPHHAGCIDTEGNDPFVQGKIYYDDNDLHKFNLISVNLIIYISTKLSRSNRQMSLRMCARCLISISIQQKQKAVRLS